MNKSQNKILDKIILIINILILFIFLLIGLKYHIVLRYGILLTTIYGGAIFIANIFKKDVSETIAISIFSIMIFLYIFGIFGFLKPSAIGIVIIYNLLGLYVIVKKILKKEIKEFSKNIFSIRIYCFLVNVYLFCNNNI